MNSINIRDVVREIAEETDSAIIDHLLRWERLRINYNDLYKTLMRDGFHVNPKGNKVLGVDIARHFGIDFNESALDAWGEVLAIQELMDELEKNS